MAVHILVYQTGVIPTIYDYMGRQFLPNRLDPPPSRELGYCIKFIQTFINNVESTFVLRMKVSDFQFSGNSNVKELKFFSYVRGTNITPNFVGPGTVLHCHGGNNYPKVVQPFGSGEGKFPVQLADP